MKICPQCDNPNTDARQRCLACGADLSQVEKQPTYLPKSQPETSPLSRATAESASDSSSNVDSTGKSLETLGTILVFFAVIVAIIGFFVGGAAPRTASYDDDFYFGTALLYAAVSFSSLFIPALFIQGFSRVILYLQQIAENTKPPQSKP